MKTILLHGDNTIKSRQRLLKFIDVSKKRDWEIVKIQTDSKLNFKETLSTNSLFKKQRVFIVEEFKNLKPSETQYLKENNEKFEGTLIIYSVKVLSKTDINNLPKIHKVEEFKIPRLIFKFLESFYPGNLKNSLNLLHEIIKTEPIEFVFALLTRHLKDLYKLSVNANSISYPSWRKNKLTSQQERFKKGEIRKIINKMSQIDLVSKTSDNNLSDLLDLLMVESLE